LPTRYLDDVKCVADPSESYALYLPSSFEAGLSDDTRRADSIAGLRDLLSRCFKQATAAAESPERSRARRVLRVVTVGAPARVQDAEYVKLIAQYRLPTSRH
jgi:hypothetical protein